MTDPDGLRSCGLSRSEVGEFTHSGVLEECIFAGLQTPCSASAITCTIPLRT